MTGRNTHRVAAVLAFALIASAVIVSQMSVNAQEQAAPTTPGPPGDLTVITLGQTAVLAEWDAPADDGGSPITSYDLSYGPVGETPTIDPVNDRHKTVTGLQPEQNTRSECARSTLPGSHLGLGASLSPPTPRLPRTRRNRRKALTTIPTSLSVAFRAPSRRETPTASPSSRNWRLGPTPSAWRPAGALGSTVLAPAHYRRGMWTMTVPTCRTIRTTGGSRLMLARLPKGR